MEHLKDNLDNFEQILKSLSEENQIECDGNAANEEASQIETKDEVNNPDLSAVKTIIENTKNVKCIPLDNETTTIDFEKSNAASSAEKIQPQQGNTSSKTKKLPNLSKDIVANAIPIVLMPQILPMVDNNLRSNLILAESVTKQKDYMITSKDTVYTNTCNCKYAISGIYTWFKNYDTDCIINA